MSRDLITYSVYILDNTNIWLTVFIVLSSAPIRNTPNPHESPTAATSSWESSGITLSYHFIVRYDVY